MSELQVEGQRARAAKEKMDTLCPSFGVSGGGELVAATPTRLGKARKYY